MAEDQRSGGIAAPQDARAVTSKEVLQGEYALIWGGQAPDDEAEYGRMAVANKQAALCLSGGGIRSAAFGLGLFQALSRARLLTGFHYLSTVSGGGYIGGWLQRWIHEEGAPKEPGAQTPPVEPIADPDAARRVMDKLGAVEEPEEIKRLRENSNFITPRVGIGSNDTWTAVSISARNILINWLLFAPLVMLIALLPNLFLDGVRSIRQAAALQPEFLYVPLGLAALGIGQATYATVRLMPSYRNASTGQRGEGDALLNKRIVYPLVFWAVVATLAIAIELLGQAGEGQIRILRFVLWGHGLDVAIFSFAGMVGGLVWAGTTLRGDKLWTFLLDWAIWPISFAVVAGLIALGSVVFSLTVAGPLTPSWGPILLTVLGPIWMLLATLLGAIVFVAFRKANGPAILPEDDREWIARLSAVKIRPMLLWLVLAPSVLLVVGLNPGTAELSISSSVTLLAGLIAVTGGRSQQSGGVVKSAGRLALKYLPLGAIVGIATLLFIVALLIVFGQFEALLAGRVVGLVAAVIDPLPPGLDPRVTAHLVIVVILGGLIYYLGRRIAVNRFSLHGFYRNRIARAFLGAARPARMPDPFTGFDSGDNALLADLGGRQGGRTILYPVINVALNVTATEKLAWQERKAEPFVFTPLYCGSGMLAPEQTKEEEKAAAAAICVAGEMAPRGAAAGARRGAYVDSNIYAAGEPDKAMGRAGVTLATAITLSGAAATPNMGYYSSPATAFLMTLFNVRLGAWLPNPARAVFLGRDIRRAGPTNSIRAMVSELTGATHDRGRNVYLSDGGHFENLALYEMIRRRCRYMVVSDAAADPACTFKDLGGAVRKVKIDLDVDIRFTQMHISGREKPLEPKLQLGWALGEVDYPERDRHGKRLKGSILYVKPSYFGDGLPVDVVAYARGSKDFPHESTLDQFFSESQFESYRRLADHALDSLLTDMGVMTDETQPPATIEAFFAALEKANDAYAKKEKPRAARKT